MIIELNPEGDLERDFLGDLARVGYTVQLTTPARGEFDARIVGVHISESGLLAISAQPWLVEDAEPPPDAPIEEFLLDEIEKVYVY